jgi:DNA-binding GntR family transcriptional regulator
MSLVDHSLQPALAKMNLASTNMAQAAYRYLRHQLLAGVYPAGTRLRYGPIGAEIGVSATPVREAANRLASEGFLEMVPNLGAVVRIPDRREVEELYTFRVALESAAVRLACRHMSESQLEECGTYVDRMGELAYAFRDSRAASMPNELLHPFMEADLAFHMLIVDAACNRFMVKSLGDLSVMTRIFLSRVRERYSLSTVVLAYSQHRRIHRAIVKQDADLAAALIQRHINIGCEIAMRSFDRIEREERLERASAPTSSVNGMARSTDNRSRAENGNAEYVQGVIR